MNEVLGPIYYIFATDQEANFKEHAEADAFFCFTNLMSEIRDNFCKSLDKSQLGITVKDRERKRESVCVKFLFSFWSLFREQ